MSAVVVGYVPSPEGRAALAKGVAEARFGAAHLTVAPVAGLPSQPALPRWMKNVFACQVPVALGRAT